MTFIFIFIIESRWFNDKNDKNDKNEKWNGFIYCHKLIPQRK